MASHFSNADRRSHQADQEPLPVQARQQMAVLTESTACLFKDVQAVQQVYQHAAQRSALRLQQAAEQLRGAGSATELLTIQSMLWVGGVQEWTQCVQEMSMTLMRMQARTMRRPDGAQVLVGPGAIGADVSAVNPITAATAATDATSAATLAMLKSWSTMMGGFTAGNGRAAH